MELPGDGARGDLPRTMVGTVDRGEPARMTAGEKVARGEVNVGMPSGVAVVRT